MTVGIKLWFGDDDPFALFIAKKYCQRVSPDTLFFDNAEGLFEAIRAANNGTLDIPDLILLDLHMWTISGEQVLAVPGFVRFVEENNLTLMTISASIDNGDKQRVESLSYVHSFYSKPLTMRMLEKILKLVP